MDDNGSSLNRGPFIASLAIIRSSLFICSERPLSVQLKAGVSINQIQKYLTPPGRK
jgi:hypothetical protein